MKTTVSWLIPVLWLVASIECLSEVVSRAPHQSTGSAFSSDQCNHHESSTSACSLEQSARRSGRRLDVQSGPDSLYQPATLLQGDYPVSAQPEFSSARFQAALELTTSWQFLWRTATEPRAPSSVS